MIDGNFDICKVTATPSGAIFSQDRIYRHLLWRTWDLDLPTLAVCGVNPSTAGEHKNDQTIEAVLRGARRWGYGRIWMWNLFDLCATDSEEMKRHPDPFGPESVLTTALVAQKADTLWAAWGRPGVHLSRGIAVKRAVKAGFNRDFHAIGFNQDGTPKHPLYLPKHAELKLWA